MDEANRIREILREKYPYAAISITNYKREKHKREFDFEYEYTIIKQKCHIEFYASLWVRVDGNIERPTLEAVECAVARLVSEGERR